MNNRLLLIALLALVAVGCNRDAQSTFIARVGDNTLTATDVTNDLETMGLDPTDQAYRSDYINRWVDRQILLLEAHDRKIDRSEDLQNTFKRLRDELLTEKLLQQAITIPEPDENAILSYWRDHAGEFTREAEEVRFVMVRLDSRSSINNLRLGLEQSKSAEMLKDRYSEAVFDTIDWIRADRLQENVARALQGLRIGYSSQPFAVDNVWAVIRLLGREPKGSLRAAQMVSAEIRSRIIAEETARKRIDYVAELRREARKKGLVRLKNVEEFETPALMEAAEDTVDTLAGKEE